MIRFCQYDGCGAALTGRAVKWCPKHKRIVIAACIAKWRAKNPGKARGWSAKWYAGNPDKASAYSAKWRAKNPEQYRVTDAKWRAKNPDKLCANEAKRRASKFQATPLWLTKQDYAEIATQYKLAAAIGAHVDHIEPLKGKNVCGLHVPWNLQPLVPAENMAKGNRSST